MAYFDEDFSFSQLFIPLTNKKAIGIIIIAGLVVFFTALFNGFVWDDTAYILNNTDIHSFSLPKIFGTSYFNKDGYYRAIPALYFTILYALAGKQAFLYHACQIILHIINTILLFRLFTYFFKRAESLLLSLLFLIHPITVESVAFIGATISPLFVFFGLCALSLLLTKKPFSALRIVGVMLFLFLSIMTKEGGILFFFIALLFTYLYHRREVLKLFLAEGSIAFLYLFFRIAVGKVYLSGFERMLFGQGSTVSDGRYVPIMELSLPQRILMIPSILSYYLKTVFYPVRLAVDQTWIITHLTLQNFAVPLLLTLAFFSFLIWFGWHLYRTQREQFTSYLFFFVWFVIGIAMHLQLIALDMTVADRWFYFPFIGLLGMLFLIFKRYFGQNKKTALLTVALLLISLLSIRTMIRNANFANEITLYEHDRLVENNYEIELNLGSAYGAVGDLDKTAYHYQKSVELYPNEANLDSMGLLSEWNRNLPAAKIYYEKALVARGFYLNPTKRLSLTYTRLSYIYQKENNFEKATTIAREGLRQNPQDQGLWIQLAKSEYKRNHQAEALIAIKKAIEIKADENALNTLKIIENKQPMEIE